MMLTNLDEEILQILRERIDADRDELGFFTGVCRSTIYDHLKNLMRLGLVTYEDVQLERKRGRPRRYFMLTNKAMALEGDFILEKNEEDIE